MTILRKLLRAFLGTDASEEPATSTTEEARLGAQEDTEAPADTAAATTEADTTQDPEPAADIADKGADELADAPPPARSEDAE